MKTPSFRLFSAFRKGEESGPYWDPERLSKAPDFILIGKFANLVAYIFLWCAADGTITASRYRQSDIKFGDRARMLVGYIGIPVSEGAKALSQYLAQQKSQEQA